MSVKINHYPTTSLWAGCDIRSILNRGKAGLSLEFFLS